MDQKLNFDISLSNIISDKDLVVENEILKVKLEADKENTFLKGEVKDLTVLLNAKIETSPITLNQIQKNASYKKT